LLAFAGQDQAAANTIEQLEAELVLKLLDLTG
jgi:hypothetical protein